MNLSVIDFIILAAIAARSLIFFRDTPALPAVLLLLAAFGLLSLLQTGLPARASQLRPLLLALQGAVVLGLAVQQPFLDFVQILYVPLSLRALRTCRGRLGAACLAALALGLNATLVLAMGWLEGLAFSLVVMAACAFLFSYEQLSARMQGEREESERLLVALQQAHRQLNEYASQAEALTAARERNRLARELHDSVSQSIFAITLTSQATRLLLARDPARVPEQLDQLQDMTAAALAQLRLLIARLRPPPAG